MLIKKYQIFTLIMLPLTALFINSCTSWQRLPGIETKDVSVYAERCGVCHAVPHPSRLDYNQWKDKIVVMKGKQMPVITAQEKEIVLSHIRNPSKKGSKTYNLRCGQCHDLPEAEKLNSEEWKELIVVLDGDMPVFSEDERLSVTRYMQTFAKKGHVESEESTFQSLGFEVPKVRKVSPHFELNNIAGDTYSIQDIEDKVSIIHFWATWCKPCREELPTLQSLWNELKKEDLHVFGIVSDKDDMESIKDFASKLELNFPILLDSEGKTHNSYLVEALPTTYIVGKDGKFLARIKGAMNWKDEGLMKHIQEIAKKK